MRVPVTRGSMNLSVKDGGLPPDSVVQDEDTILSDCERVMCQISPAGRGRADTGGIGAVFAFFGDAIPDVRLRGTGGKADAGCIRIWRKPTTKMNFAGLVLGSVRWIIWKRLVGSMTGHGWLTAFIFPMARLTGLQKAV